MKQSMQRAYVPKEVPGFHETLQRARIKRAAQGAMLTRLAVVAVIVVGVISLALSYQGSEATVAPVPLQAIKIEAPEPTNTPAPTTNVTVEEAPQPAGEKPPKKKPEKTEGVGYLIVNTFPLIDLTVIVDRKATSYKTPVGGEGIPLSAGVHWIYFKGESSGELYGPFQISISRDTTTREMFDVGGEKTIEQQKQTIKDKLVGFDQKDPAPTKAEPKKDLPETLGFDGKPLREDAIANPFKKDPLPRSAYGYLQIETKPKKALLVYINGKDSGFTTPVRDTGVRMLPGTYQIELRDESNVSYGKFSVIINEGSTQKQTVSVSKKTSSQEGFLENPFKSK